MMTDQSLRRADELLSELVDLVETARNVPMSSSCVLPRERVLDLLDELRETMPPEMDQARRVIATRDAVLQGAHEEAEHRREHAATQAEALLADGRGQAEELVREAEVRAQGIVEAAVAERENLVSATGVRQAAADQAESLRAAANRYDADVRAEAEKYAQATRAEAQHYAAKLTGDSEEYVDRTLAELAATLRQAVGTAEQGRAALAERRAAEHAQTGHDAAISD
jgi:cell division septum initiation protein DivIVA